MVGDNIKIPRNIGGTLDAIMYKISSVTDENTDKSIQKPPIIILCHGFTGDKYEWGRFTRTAERLVEVGFECILFDFSGSGKNKREPVTLSQQVQDLIDVYEWMTNKGYKRISTIGLSFGGLTSVIPDLPLRKCAVFWAPAFYLIRIFNKPTKLFLNLITAIGNPIIKRESKNNDPIIIDKNFYLEIKKLDVENILANFSLPTLVIQGLDDTQIFPKNTREAYSHFPDDIDKKLVEIENATHDFDGPQLEEFIDHSIKWLKKYL